VHNLIFKRVCMTSRSNIRICVPLCAETFAELEQLTSQAANVADLIELRLDCLDEPELDVFQQRINGFVGALSIPVIITLRASEQGGHRQISMEQRREFWQNVIRPANALFDIEKDLCEEGFAEWAGVICSHHDFDRTPENLEEVYQQMAATPACILKIAIYAHDTIDCLPVFRLLTRAHEEGRELIALAMGDAGVATRILGPSRGSFLTFGALAQDAGTAPGQLTAERMKSIYHIDKISKQTRIYGLVGSPVMQSVSPHIHNVAFDSEGIDAVYLPLEVKNLRSFMERMVHPVSRELDWRLSGLSITAPHKLEVMQYLDWIDPHAKDIGAVNTVVVEADGLRGYNTDVDGLIGPLLDAIALTPNSKVAVIGAGGAANAAVWSLKERGASVALFARDPQKARSLAERFDVSYQPLESASFGSFDVVINATPLGSLGKQIDETPATSDQLRGVRLAYDMVYNPVETRFLREARNAGCQTLGGLEMLVAQAQLQFKLWTGQEAPKSVMHSAALRGLFQANFLSLP
jgi:3-dehydroquinate dehydratase / shikimate dehydrogenase